MVTMQTESHSRSTWATVFFASIVVLTLGLGIWQWNRAAEKEALRSLGETRAQAVLNLPAWEESSGQPPIQAQDWNRQVTRMRGRWLDRATVYLDNRAESGRAGVHVVSLFQLEDGSLAWINRGWYPKAPGRSDPSYSDFRDGRLALPTNGSSTVELQAIALIDWMTRMELSADPESLRDGALWQNLDWPTARALADKTASTTRIWPLVFWQTSEADDGLIRAVPAFKNEDVSKHLGYAAQWWLMSLAAAWFAWRFRPSRPFRSSGSQDSTQ